MMIQDDLSPLLLLFMGFLGVGRAGCGVVFGVKEKERRTGRERVEKVRGVFTCAGVRGKNELGP